MLRGDRSTLLSLRFSSTVGQGPYQGFESDLVVGPRLGTASGAVGSTRTLSSIGGAMVMLTLGIGLAHIAVVPGLPVGVIGLALMGTGAGTYLAVDRGS